VLLEVAPWTFALGGKNPCAATDVVESELNQSDQVVVTTTIMTDT